ncbi:MAG: hypothetical protein GY811_30695 [Myxococcales bacterium]|nr:hypothetical protein [Myxococcales bacterium]
MTSKPRSRSNLSSLILIATTAIGTQAALSGDAAADSVSVRLGASASVEAGVHVDVDGFIGALAQLETGLSIGIGFAEPPPPPPVPSYYVEYAQPAPVYAPPVYAAPVYAAPLPVLVERPMAPVAAPLRRWGLGGFAGSVHVDDQEVGSDLGLVGRYRLSSAWAVEGEIAKTESTSGARVDRRMGGALVWNLPLGHRLKPSLLLGAGYGQSEFGKGELHAEQGYGEVGAGLQYRLSGRLHLTADVRAGTRTTSDEVMYVGKHGVVDLDEEENYSRARIGAMFFF